MKNFFLYLYHLLTWLFLLVWGYALDAFPTVKKFLFTWSEIISIPLALVLWYFSPGLLRWMDPTAATFDSGVLQVYLLAAIGLLLMNGVVWLILKLNFPGLYKFLDTAFEENVLHNPSLNSVVSEREKMFHLSTYQKCVISLSVFVLYFAAAILLVRLQ